MRQLGTCIALSLALITTASACGDDDNQVSTPDVADGTALDTADTSATNQDTSTTDVEFVKCEPFGPSVCAENEHCTFFGNNADSVCAPSGPIETGDFCGQQNRCAEGICLALNGTSPRCFDFCRDTNDCGSEPCISLNDAKFAVCRVAGIYPTCDLLAQNCDEDKACYNVQDEPKPVCLTAGEVTDGEACTYADSCTKGSACVNSLCRRLCDPAATGSCDTGFLCTTINESAHGFCAPE